MVYNQNKNSTGLIYGSQGFAICAQILSAKKIGWATAIQKLWVKWTLGSWGPGYRLWLFQIPYINIHLSIDWEILWSIGWTKQTEGHISTTADIRMHCLTDISTERRITLLTDTNQEVTGTAVSISNQRHQYSPIDLFQPKMSCLLSFSGM